MGKLIGTGKDPRLIEGQDFDVPDPEVEHYEDAGLGKPVDPATPEGMAEIHPAEKIIIEDPQKEDEQRGRSVIGDHTAYEDNVAARVESTSRLGGKRGAKKAAEKRSAEREEAVTGSVDPEDIESRSQGAHSAAGRSSGSRAGSGARK